MYEFLSKISTDVLCLYLSTITFSLVDLTTKWIVSENTPRGGPAQYNQLEILYRARGNKIEELISEVKQVKDDSDREIRILKHKLSLMQGQ